MVTTIYELEERARAQTAARQAEAEHERLLAEARQAEAERERLLAAAGQAEAERERLLAAAGQAEAEREQIHVHDLVLRVLGRRATIHLHSTKGR
jgi:hypothetical protein